MTITVWNPVPQLPTTFLVTVTDEIGNDLTGLTIQGDSNPGFVAIGYIRK